MSSSVYEGRFLLEILYIPQTVCVCIVDYDHLQNVRPIKYEFNLLTPKTKESDFISICIICEL